MAYEVDQQDLVSLQHPVGCPHVVVLGAGASVAAFPNGDAQGRRLPVMANLVEVLGLKDMIVEARQDPTAGFESIYSHLHAADSESPLVKEIERRVEDYFSQLVLPKYPTIYDLLLLSLREKDAIFTFNWDPFLIDAYERLADDVRLPHIFHLHGNVRLSFCACCSLAMRKADVCHKCGTDLTQTRLLFPVEQKNYADDLFIASQWEQVRDFIARAFIITIFGYSAPTTDAEAMAIFTKAWKKGESSKLVERLEVIDIRDHEELALQWSPFAHFHHCDIRGSLYESCLSRCPRRSCEALFHRGVDGKFVKQIAWAGNLEGMINSVARLIAHER
jgi:hypothetical protein